MKIVIFGSNHIARSIAAYFALDDHDVFVIGHEAQSIKEIDETLDVRTILGLPSYPGLLEEAGAENADVFIAVGTHDEENMFACQAVQGLYGIPVRIACLHNAHYLPQAWKKLYLGDVHPVTHVISPESMIAFSILKSLEVQGALDVADGGAKDLRIIKLRCMPEAPILKQTLSDFCTLYPHVAFLYVNRDQTPFVPDEKTTFLEDDHVYCLVPLAYVEKILPLFGIERLKEHQYVILGGGNVAYHLAKGLLERDKNVHIIEKNELRAAYLSEKLPGAIIICGNALDANMMAEAGVRRASAVVSVMNDDENNILGGLLSQNMGASLASVLVSNQLYPKILPSLGLHAVINPQSVTIGEVLRCVPHNAIEVLYHILDDIAFVLKISIKSGQKIVGKSYKEFCAEYNIFPGLIVRDDEILFIDESIVAEVDDFMICLVERKRALKLKKIF